VQHPFDYDAGMPGRSSVRPQTGSRPSEAVHASEGAELSRAWRCGKCGAREVTHTPSMRPQRCLACFALEGRDSEFTPLDDAG
jgi:hypothetical protein